MATGVKYACDMCVQLNGDVYEFTAPLSFTNLRLPSTQVHTSTDIVLLRPLCILSRYSLLCPRMLFIHVCYLMVSGATCFILAPQCYVSF